MALPRFLVPDLDPARGEAALPAEEAHHLGRVLRLGPGAEVEVFDGRGHGFRAEVVDVTRTSATVRLGRQLQRERPAVALTLAQAVLKGDAMDDVVRDATMVGVDAIVPLVTARVAVRSAALSKPLDRWRRIALSSAKQCGRLTLPLLAEPISLDDWLGTPRPASLLLVEPDAVPESALTLRDVAARPVAGEAAVVVGPEGGWASDEIQRALDAGCTPLSLGPLTLRAATVPVIAAAALVALAVPSGRQAT